MIQVRSRLRQNQKFFFAICDYHQDKQRHVSKFKIIIFRIWTSIRLTSIYEIKLNQNEKLQIFFLDIYREKIPADSPPSYRGQLVKYSYKIIISTQRVNHPVKFLRVPIRVLPLCEVSLNEAGALCNETTEELTPTNPFLEIRQKETSLDISLQTLQVMCMFSYVNNSLFIYF